MSCKVGLGEFRGVYATGRIILEDLRHSSGCVLHSIGARIGYLALLQSVFWFLSSLY